MTHVIVFFRSPKWVDSPRRFQEKFGNLGNFVPVKKKKLNFKLNIMHTFRATDILTYVN